MSESEYMEEGIHETEHGENRSRASDCFGCDCDRTVFFGSVKWTSRNHPGIIRPNLSCDQPVGILSAVCSPEDRHQQKARIAQS